MEPDRHTFRIPMGGPVVKLLLFCVLLLVYWPAALLALILYPVLWLLLLPFRILGFAVEGVLGLVSGIILFPGRVLRRV